MLVVVKAARYGFGNRSMIRRLADLRLDELKDALEEVCAVRVLLF